jgi:hypothetical protein
MKLEVEEPQQRKIPSNARSGEKPLVKSALCGCVERKISFVREQTCARWPRVRFALKRRLSFLLSFSLALFLSFSL